jgi:TonB-dependent receptor
VGPLQTTVSDLSGAYTLEEVPAGRHDLVVEKGGFTLLEVHGVRVEAGQITRIDVPVTPADQQVVAMEAFKVEADILQQSAMGLLVSRQRSLSVMDSIAADEFSQLGVGDAAEALGKTPGTTILDGKYAVIRGLSDRYTYTQMNGSSVPSADPDRRAVQLDQFPVDLIDSITTRKSFTPDQPGAFSGGSVDLQTKTFPEVFFGKISVGSTYNARVTGQTVLSVPGGGRDWQGRDDGTRRLSDRVPNPIPANLTSAAAQLAARQGNFVPARQLDEISRQFHNEPFFPRDKKAAPDFAFSASAGDSLTVREDHVFGYVTSLTYDRSTSHFEGGTTGRYSQGSVDPANARFVDVNRVFTPDVAAYNFAPFYEANPVVPGGPPPFGVATTSEQVTWGAYLQLAWRAGLNHELSTTFFHNQSAADTVKRGVGEAVRSDSGGEFRENYDLLYTERGVTSVQLAGRSLFPRWDDATFEWRAAVSRSTQEQPDYRSFESKWSFILQEFDPSGITNRRYFRDLQEDSTDLAFDFTRPFYFSSGREWTLKLGAAHLNGERTNRERAFLIEGGNIRTRAGIESFPQPVGIIAETAASVSFGSVMREISANLNYDGEQTFSAGYAMADLRWSERWRFVGGVRGERTEISTRAQPVSGITVRPAETDQTDALPALAVIWSPRDRQNVRLSYGRTLARPTFRELADVVNYEAFTDEFIGGNPDLAVTLIDNLDLRWEWFPRGGEVLAASLFYKRLDQPIEQVFSAGRIFPNNVDAGIAYGIEVEARRKLDFLGPRWEQLSFGLNAALIESEVTIPPDELALIRAVFPDARDHRPLYGQSPYIVNLDVTLQVPAWSSTFTLATGVFGERLDLVTTGALPDVFEQPAPSLDFIWSQRLFGSWRMKLAAKNLLDPHREKSLEHNGTTYFYERYRRGRTFSLSVSYDFQ